VSCRVDTIDPVPASHPDRGFLHEYVISFA
jgi:hypothetical protein